MNNKTINEIIVRHENFLRDLINKSDIPATKIKEAIVYALFPGGKRLRPVVIYLCGRLLDTNTASLDVIAAAMELTHCYSLVHDDLPAMDNDDLRRGKPSCHKAFDEATAILAGDAMQILAIDVLLHYLPQTLDFKHVVQITKELATASGPAGMISGQSLDLSPPILPTQAAELQLRQIHMLKTGQLFIACVNMVLEASNASPENTEALRHFAFHLGLAFQMQDDYLDKYDTETHLGKGRSSDAANDKVTFATLYDQQALSSLVTEHFNHAKKSLILFKDQAADLYDLVQNLQCRT